MRILKTAGKYLLIVGSAIILGLSIAAIYYYLRVETSVDSFEDGSYDIYILIRFAAPLFLSALFTVAFALGWWGGRVRLTLAVFAVLVVSFAIYTKFSPNHSHVIIPQGIEISQ